MWSPFSYLSAATEELSALEINTLTEEKRKEFAQSIIDEFVSKCNDTEWDSYGVKNDVNIYTKDFPGTYVKAVKGVGKIKGRVQKMFDLTKKIEHIGKWDPLYVSGRIVHSYDDDSDIINVCYSSGVPLVRNRDFVYLEARAKLEDGSMIVAATSVQHPAAPANRDVIRAELTSSGWMFKPINDEEAIAYYIAHVDPKGIIPKSLVNYASGAEALNIHNLRLCMEAVKS